MVGEVGTGFVLPRWLDDCATVAARAAEAPSTRGRLVLALPTLEFAAAGVALRLTQSAAEKRATTPLSLIGADHVGKPVSTFVGGKFEDASLTAVSGAEVRVGLVRVTTGGFADVIRPLPDGFPNRRTRKPSLEIAASWGRVLGVDRPDVARRIHARVSARPVLVIGEPGAFGVDVDELAGQPGTRFVDAGGVDGWLRHPVITSGTTLDDRQWLTDVDPSVVIVCGAAGWRSPLRRAVHDALQVVLLDRTAQATPEVVDEMALGVQADLPEPRPRVPAGVGAWSFVEAAAATVDDDGEEVF